MKPMRPCNNALSPTEHPVSDSPSVGRGAVVRSPDPRVSTGNPTLDAMLEGGLVAHRPYLIVGPSGTGKTTLAIQFLCEGVRRKERVLLVTLEEPPNEARVNHRGLEPELGRVEVFDAIPDIMRYERTPFKDIASVRTAIPFADVPIRIRRSPELTSVEVTITALEQMLRTEVIRRGYTRIVIDSLTALQYFCMKGFDPVAGAQSFLRYLSDLRVTTLLTVESPLEDIETPERMLARGEIRLFRWELDGQTVRAVGVEKFRGSSHDVRLHPYRIGPRGIDINLDVTISRDTRQIIEPIVPRPRPVEAVPVAPAVPPIAPLVDEVRDLILIGADVAPARSEIEAALAATNEGRLDEAQAHLSRITSQVMVLVDQLSRGPGPLGTDDPGSLAAFQRVLARADSVRTGIPPTSLPPASVLQVQLGALLSLLPIPTPPPEPVSVPEVTVPLPPPPPSEPPAPPATVELPTTAPVAEAVPPPPLAAATEVEAPVAAAPVVETPPSPPVELPPAPPPPETPTPAPAVEPPVVLPPSNVAPRPKPTRGLPPPPKPRPSVPAPRVAKPAPSTVARASTPRGEPPPLPSTSAPEWPSPTPLPPHAGPGSHAGVRPAPVVTPVAPGPAARATASAAKKKRKAPAPAKKPSSHARVPTAHEVVESPAPPSESVVLHPGSPEGPSSGPLVESPPVPKPRRRPARKRKAPPVVSVTVEPIPPGVFGTVDDVPKSSETPDKSPPPEE